MVVGFSAPIAAAAMAMGQYLSRVLVETGVIAAGSQSTSVTIVALTGVTAISIVHLFDVRIVSRFQIFFTTLKVSLILALIVCGFALATAQPVSFLPDRASLGSVFTSGFAVSLVYVMYAYSGGMRRSTWPAMSGSRGATCRCRSSSGRSWSSCSTRRSTPCSCMPRRSTS